MADVPEIHGTIEPGWEAVRDAFARWGGDIACVIVEPVAGNMGLVPPQPGFLEGLRELCDRTGALLVFDEVMTGFRVAWQGAQGLYLSLIHI